MTTTINLHGPYTYKPHHYPAGTTHRNRSYASFEVEAPGATLFFYLHTRAEVDALVKAALAARDMLPGPAPETSPGPDEVAAGLTTWHAIPAHLSRHGGECRYSGLATNRADGQCPDRCQSTAGHQQQAPHFERMRAPLSAVEQDGGQ